VDRESRNATVFFYNRFENSATLFFVRFALLKTVGKGLYILLTKILQIDTINHHAQGETFGSTCKKSAPPGGTAQARSLNIGLQEKLL
jgi:hypothetical protein